MSDSTYDPSSNNGTRDPHGTGSEVPHVTGRVEDVQGEGDRPCPDYLPTRDELEVLARHWIGVYFANIQCCVADGSTESKETRIRYVLQRIDTIGGMTDEAMMQNLWATEMARQVNLLNSPDSEGMRRRFTHRIAHAVGEQGESPF